jgi:DNA repair protein RadC
MEPTITPAQEKLNSIKYWAEDDRPREKMQIKGRLSLSNAELLAILINTGTKNDSALALAQKLLQNANNSLNALSKQNLADLTKVKGIGMAKAITIAAALELGRRRKDEDAYLQTTIKSSREAYNYFEAILVDKPHEEFWVLFLNRSNKVIGRARISEGGVTGTIADPKLIFKQALEKLSCSIILCHNHPSGNLKPSQADIDLTKKLVQAGKLLDIFVFDHIIFTDTAYYSFADEGILNT